MSSNSGAARFEGRMPFPPVPTFTQSAPRVRPVHKVKLPSFARPITLATNDGTSLLSWCVQTTYTVIEKFIETAQLNHSITRAIGWDDTINKPVTQHPDGIFRISDEIYGELITWYARHVRDGHDLYPGLSSIFELIVARTDTDMFELLLKNFSTYAVLPDPSAPNYDAVASAFRNKAKDIVSGGSSRSGSGGRSLSSD